MLSLTIEDQKIEHIFLQEFQSDKDKFFSFIKESYERIKDKTKSGDLKDLQISSMQKTWDNDEDRVWDAL